LRKFLATSLIALCLLALVPVISLLIIARVQHKSVHQEFVSIINQTLDGDITIQDFSLSYLRSFPKVSIRIKELTLGHQAKQVQRIGELEMRLNLLRFWNREIRLDDLIIRDGALFSMVDSLGNKTRLFPEKDSATAKTEKRVQPIEIENIRMYNCKLQFGNDFKRNRVQILVHHAHLNLSAQDSLLYIRGNISGHLDSLISNNSALIADHPFTGGELVLKVNQITGVKELIGGHVDMHTLRLTPRFQMKPHLNGQLIEVHVDGGDSFNNLMGLIEFHSGLAIEQVSPEAELRISFNQSGFVSPLVRPYTELDFEIIAAEFTGEKFPQPIEVGKIKGNYNNGEAHSTQTTMLVIDTLYAFIGDSYVHGKLKLTNLNDPVIDSRLMASLDLTHIVPQTENIGVAGTIEADVHIEGRISDLKDAHSKGKKSAKGTIEVKDLRLLVREQGYNLNFVNGSILLNNHLLEVTRLVGAFNESAFRFQGNFENLDEYIIEENQDLSGKFVLNFEQLDIRSLMKDQGKKPAVKPKNASALNLAGLSFDFLVQGKEVITDFGNLKDLKVDSHFENSVLDIHSFALNYQDGTLGGYGEVWLDDGAIDSITATINGKFGTFEFQSPEADKGDKQDEPFIFPDFINANIALNISQGQAAGIEFKDVVLHTNILGEKVGVHKLKFEAFGGTTDVTGSLLFGEEGLCEIMAKGEVHYDQVDLEPLLGNNPNRQDSTKQDLLEAIPALELDLIVLANNVLYRDFKISSLSSHIVAGSANPEKGNTDFPLSFGLDKLQIDTRVSKLLYNNAGIDDIHLVMVYANDKLELNRFNFAFADGSVDMTGYLNREKGNVYPGYILARIDTIDIEQLFAAFDNFDQTAFTDQNTSGQISTSAHYYFMLDQNFKPSGKDNLLIAGSRIHHVELDKVEPIEKTLFFVGHKAKDKMIISELDMNLVMIGNVIYFNDVFMNDNIANLDAFGKVNLDNQMMDVGLEVSLTDLFFRTKKERVAETMEGIVKLDTDAKLYLDINGSLNDQKLKLISGKKFHSSRKVLMKEVKKAEKLFQQTHSKASQIN
jgi:prepilin-type processing-associated H-X9-DG protein